MVYYDNIMIYNDIISYQNDIMWYSDRNPWTLFGVDVRSSNWWKPDLGTEISTFPIARCSFSSLARPWFTETCVNLDSMFISKKLPQKESGGIISFLKIQLEESYHFWKILAPGSQFSLPWTGVYQIPRVRRFLLFLAWSGVVETPRIALKWYEWPI